MVIRSSPKSVWFAVLSAFVVTTVNYAAAPGASVSGEAVASSTTTAAQQSATVARAANGDYVVVWAGNGTGDADGIYFQRRSASGDAIGAETRVNTTTAGAQTNPAVAIDPTASFGIANGSSASGSFVVAWESADAGTDSGVYYRVYNADGTSATAETAANTTTTNAQSEPAVAMSATGTFVIAWQSVSQAPDSSGSGVFFRRYDAAGVAQGAGESPANTYVTLSQASAAVAMDAAGNFIIVWQSNQQLSAGEVNDIFGQRFAANGNTAGSEFQVDVTTAGEQTAPSVAMDADGDFVVAWQGASASNGLEIYARAYDSAGSPGSEFIVNGTAAGDQTLPAVAMDADGDFTVAWQGPDASGAGIYYRLYDASAAAQTAEGAANSTTSGNTGAQQKPAVAVDADGDPVVVWESDHSDAAFNVYMRRFAGPEAVDVAIEKDDTPDPVAVNSTLTYRVTVANLNSAQTPTGVAGIDAAIGGASTVTFTDTWPASLSAPPTISPEVANDWACSYTAGSRLISCRYEPLLAPGASTYVDISGTTGISPAEITNSAVMTADQDDDAAAANTSTELTAVCVTPNAGSVGFSSATFSQAETSAAGGVDATITVSRTPGPCVPAISVEYSTVAGGSAEAGDYSNASGTLTWAANDVADKTFTVHVNFDTVDEPADTVALALSNPDRASIDTPAATLTITDDDAAPNVTLTVDRATAPEAGAPLTDTATITATLAAPSEQTATVDLLFSGTATRDTTCGGSVAGDYTCSGTSITINPGAASGAMTFLATQDTVNELDETVIADINAVTNATEATPQQVTTTIVDDDATPTVQFQVVSSGVDEEGAFVDVVVELSANNSAATTVTFTVGGTATTTTDFTLDTDTGTAGNQGSPITIPANTASRAIRITPVDDSGTPVNEDPAETIVLTLTGVTTGNATVGANATHTLTFTEDENAPTVTFSADPAAAAENGQTVTVTATLSGQNSAAVDVPFTVSGTANKAYDHTAGSCEPSNCKITIAAGQTTGTYAYTVANDTRDDDDTESVVLTMGTPVNATQGAKTTHTFTINDNDATAPNLSFTSASQSVAETGDTATITAQLNAPTGRPAGISVPITVTGSAGAGDFTFDADAGTAGNQSSPIVIADGQSLSPVATFTIIDDQVDEPNETVTLTMGNAANATEVAPTVHTLTITDDDDFPVLTFEVDAQTVVEGVGATTVRLLLSRTSSQDVNAPFSILVGMANDASSADYTIDTNPVTPGNQGSPVTIPAGATEATITIGVVDDTADEDDQTLRMALGTPTNATLGTPSTHTVTIQDDNVNDPLPSVTLTITPANGQFAEQSGTATVNATLSNPTEKGGNVSLGLQVVNGTASAADYTTSGSTLTIPANGTATTATTPVTLTGAPDLADEADETLTVNLNTVSANATEATPQAVAATVVDDDGSYTIDDVTVTEGNTGTQVARFTVTRTASGYATTINYTTTPGTATEGSDYQDKTGVLNFPANAATTTQFVDVIVNGDILDEASDETYTVTLSGASGGTIADATGAGTITDNDTAGVVVTESAGSTAVTEGGATDSVSVVLTSQPTANVTITASATDQVTLSPTTLTFTPANYATPQVVTVTAVNDKQVEDARSATLSGAATSADANYSGSLGTITVSVSDNDSVTPGDNAPGVVVTVSGGAVSVSSNGGDGGGGAFSAPGLLALLGLLGLRRRRAMGAALACLMLAGGAAQAQQPAAAGKLSYRYADLRYVSGDSKDPDVGLSGFSLSGMTPVRPNIFVTGSYAQADTDDFRAFGAKGSVKSSTFSVGGGMRRVLKPGLDATGTLSIVNAKAQGEGGFSGDSSDTGYGLEAGLRAWRSPEIEWGVSLNYVSIFDDSSTSLNAQGLYHFKPGFAAVLGAGFSDSATQFNLGGRYSF